MIEPQVIALQAVFDALEHGATVVTGNNRLAAHTRRAFEGAARDRGRTAWPTPEVLPWTAWLRRTWEVAVVAGGVPAPALLLSAGQEQCLWEDILGQSLAGQPLVQVAGTVREAAEAWRLLQSWRLPLRETVFRYNSDSAVFWEWAREFEARCKRQDWLPGARIADELQRSVETGALPIPGELIFLDFDELTPQQQSLLQALLAAGCAVHWLQLAGRVSRTTRLGCADVRQEAAAVARWARQRLEDHPTAEIGIVVPDLAAERDCLLHALDEILAPEALQPGRHAMARPYNLSLGPPLCDYPIIGTALRLLGLLEPELSLEDAGRILRSPFLAGWEPEASARALLDGRLRENGELKLSLRTLSHHASQTDRPYFCPLLVPRLEAWAAAVRDCPRSARPGAWSERFALWLQAVGWARGRGLSSAEHQAAEAWRELLGAFAALDPVTQPMSAAVAVGRLRRMAGERSFQPQTGTAPVQVLGMLEAGGLHFDHLWITGLHDGVWPASPRPNPFIPLPLQRQAGLPHSSEERELQVARTITTRLLASAPEVVVSYPQQAGDATLRQSPLIAAFPKAEVPEDLGLWSAPTWRYRVHHSASLVSWGADPAPPLRNTDVAGGSAVFKLQAACPFRAFAELRLKARGLEQAEIGLDARTRGSLIHRVLEQVWLALDSQEQLLAIAETPLAGLIRSAVTGAIGEIAGRYPHTFQRRFRELETERLCRQVQEWLALEKHREPFRVTAREARLEAVAGGIRVQVKVDRIDTLADGRKVVIDYKSGEVKPAQWFGARPEEPQLPLYSMAVSGEIAGVLFAQVRAGGMAFNGVAAEVGLAPGVKSYTELRETRAAHSWQDVLHAWRATMETLGAAFRTGAAAVDPKQYPGTCRYCELTPLCRIHELPVWEDESAGTGEEHE